MINKSLKGKDEGWSENRPNLYPLHGGVQIIIGSNALQTSKVLLQSCLHQGKLHRPELTIIP